MYELPVKLKKGLGWTVAYFAGGISYGAIEVIVRRHTHISMLLLGGLYLVVRRVITPRIPLCFIGTVAVLTYLFPLGGNSGLDWMLCHLLSGGLILGAVFMATDYSTSPVTKRGQYLYGIGCGALTVFLRYFGAYPEGVSFAILLMNTAAWLLDKVGQPRRFGNKTMKHQTIIQEEGAVE